MSKIRIIGRNITCLAANRVVIMLVAFFLFPFVVGRLGKEAYGIYAIVMTITGYFGLFDMGVASALTKYVAEYKGKNDELMINKIINVSFFFYLIVGIIVFAGLFFCSAYGDRFFKIIPENCATVKTLFLVASVFSFFIWPLNTFRGVMQGMHLWDRDAAINTIVQVLNAAGTVILLSGGYGVISLLMLSQSLMLLGGI